jgi:hypothetical protein
MHMATCSCPNIQMNRHLLPPPATVKNVGVPSMSAAGDLATCAMFTSSLCAVDVYHC